VITISDLSTIEEGSAPSFVNFIRGQRRARLYLRSGIIISLLLVAIFKFFYPYPNLVFDSYYYIKAAAQNANVNAWPIGYSKFLWIFGWFSHSPLWLVIFQYLFLQFCNGLFFFTLLYFYRPGTVITNILFCFLFLNPLFLYLSNLIMADALFTGLSILWITQLLWIIFRPRSYMVLTHALLLLITFSVRYNALYYPLVAALAFILCRQQIWLKLAGIAVQFILLGGFILYTSNRVADLTGERQFSPFGGWKVANDALFMYAHIQPEKGDLPPEKFRSLDHLVQRYFAYTHDNGDLMRRDQFWGSYYMFDNMSPLVQYMLRQDSTDNGFINSKRWAAMAPLYAAYGSWLIRKYPTAYARYFLWPNTIRYVIPTLEIFQALSPFYLRDDDLGIPARDWFGLRTLTPQPFYINLRTYIFSYYPIINLLILLAFILGGIGFLLLKGWRKVSRPILYSMILICTLWLGNLCFNVIAAAVVFRYLVFIMVVGFAFSLLLLEFIYQHLDKSEVPKVE